MISKGSNYRTGITGGGGEGREDTRPNQQKAQAWSYSTGFTAHPSGSDPSGFCCCCCCHPSTQLQSSLCTSVLQHWTCGPHQRSTLLQPWRHSPMRGTKRCLGNGWLGFMYDLQLLFRAVRQMRRARPHLERSKQKLNYLAHLSLTFSSASVLPSILLMAFWTRARRLDKQSKRLTTFSRSPMNIM